MRNVPATGPVRQSFDRPMTESLGATLPSDETLVTEARAGVRRSFEALVRRYQKPLYYLCLRYVHEHDAACDLAQRSFIKALERLDELRDPGTFRGWLFRIAANLSLNHLRDNARFVDEDDHADDGADPHVAPEGHTRLEAGEESEALRRAVAGLPTKQRMTLELRVYEELPFKEIASALGTTEGAAKVNFHYAVRKLRTLLGGAFAGKAGGR